MTSAIRILVTRELTGQQIEYARILGLEPIIRPALEFKFPEYWDEVLKTITKNSKVSWVFTSTNGVKALEKLMEKGFQVNPQRRVYAVGSKTQKALRKLGLEVIIPHLQNGAHLADKIIDEREKEVLYFHGNLSRDEMTNKLNEKGITVSEVEVYQTIIHPVKMPVKTIEAILFYSPSTVEGFKQGTGFDNELPQLFAIGQTTAGALQEVTDQPIEVAAKPDTNVLLRTVSEHLFQNKAVKSPPLKGD